MQRSTASHLETLISLRGIEMGEEPAGKGQNLFILDKDLIADTQLLAWGSLVAK
jgi:hypothetical protein